MPTRSLVVLIAVLACLTTGCQIHGQGPTTQEYRVAPFHSVQYDYTPPHHADAHFYTDRHGHFYPQRNLNASHGGYGAYGVLKD